jgi:hypothetical protein
MVLLLLTNSTPAYWTATKSTWIQSKPSNITQICLVLSQLDDSIPQEKGSENSSIHGSGKLGIQVTNIATISFLPLLTGFLY